MNQIEKLVCDYATELADKNWDIAHPNTPTTNEYKLKKLNIIKNDLQAACWVIMELPRIINEANLNPKYKKYVEYHPVFSSVKDINGTNVLFYRNHLNENWKVKKAIKKKKTITYWT